MLKTAFSIKKALEIKHFIPILSLIILLVTKNSVNSNAWFSITASIFLGVCVMASVHHAEIIAHKIGEGLGTLVLAVSVTILEVGLIISLMGQNGPESSILARDTVFSAVMIVTNGIVALCLILGGLKFKEQEFQVQGSRSLLVVLVALCFLVFILPNYTTTTAGPTYSTMQMVFIGAFCLILYMLFVFFQTTSHKSYFEPTLDIPSDENAAEHVEVSKIDAWLSFFSLCLSLVAVIGFAKTLSPTIERGVLYMGAPKTIVGLLIALIVLLPESWAAIAASRSNRLQTSLNLALGSGIASIALTIPVVIAYSIFTQRSLVLGLEPKNMVLMMMTFAVTTLTLGSGKSTLLQGAVHAVILLTYFVVSLIP